MVRVKPALSAACALVICTSALLARAQADDGIKTIIQKTRQATAYVQTRDGSGTAWVVDKANRLLVTNQHVVEDHALVHIWFPLYKDGKVVTERKAYKEELGLRGKVLDTDVERDLALIQLKDRLPEDAGELALSADGCEAGDSLHTIGHPGASGGAMWVYTPGRVRAVFDKEWPDLDFNRRVVNWRKAKVVLADSAVNPGDSGGPCVNGKGEVVAVVSHGKTIDKGRAIQNMNAHIDVSEVRAFVEQTRRLMNPESASDFVARAKRLIEARRYDDAVEDLSQAIKLDKSSAAAFERRGWLFFSKGDYDTAIADCDRAIKLDEDNAPAYYTRAWANERKKDHDKALADYTRAIQIDTKFARAYNNRGVMYHDIKKEPSRAFADYTRAIELDARNDVARANRGDLHHDFKDYDKALADAEAALDINPFNRAAWNVRGWVLRDRGEPAKAVQNFTQALEFDPRNPSFFFNRGVALSKIDGQLAGAVANYNRAIELDADYHWAYLYRGQAFESASKFADAQADYEKALRLYPKHSERIKRQQVRFLRVVNETSEPIKVYVQYEYVTPKGEWVWWPADPTKPFWSFKVGEASYLLDDGWKLKARRIRIYGVGQTSGKVTNTEHWNEPIWLCPKDGYLGMNETTFTYTFNSGKK